MWPSRSSLRRLRRYPPLWWTAVVALAVLVGLTVNNSMLQAERASARLGKTARVLVTKHALAPGTVLSSRDFTNDVWPLAFVGGSPLTTEISGRVLTVPLLEGEPLLREKVAPAGLSPVAALLGPEEQAVTVTRGEDSSPLRQGDSVAIYAYFGQTATEATTTRLLTRSARVLEAGERSATLAVRASEVPAVAAAVARAVIVLTITMPG